MAKAHITATEAVRTFAEAMREFDWQARDAVTQTQLVARRLADWIEDDRLRYWEREARKASDGVNEARINLQRCEIAIRPDDRKPCTDEKKALEKARRRQQLAEEKVQTTRAWVVKLRHEVEEFIAHVAQLSRVLDSESPRALAALERMSQSLEKYAALTAPDSSPPKGASS